MKRSCSSDKENNRPLKTSRYDLRSRNNHSENDSGNESSDNESSDNESSDNESSDHESSNNESSDNHQDNDIGNNLPPPIHLFKFVQLMQQPPPPPRNEPPPEEEEEIETESETDDFYNDEDYDEIIEKEIKTIDDLIELGSLYNPLDEKKYNINLKRLHNLIEPLEELQNMIGMEKVKVHILDMILYYLQDFEKRNKNILHTALYGPPGCGKTDLAHILAKIYCKMGVIKKDFVHVVRRSDLIGKFLGHTAKLTQEAIDKAKDGVLLIDEAYSLGNSEQRDSFAKECIDTINQNLTENKGQFVCIIAGYREALEKCFFAYNQGLERRFPFRFTIDKYTAEDIRLIFLKKVRDEKWSIEDIEVDIPGSFFEKNRDIFKYNGGDMETLFHMVRIVHARRVFCLPRNQKKIITHTDMERALDMFINDDAIKNRNEEMDISKSMMYS